MKSYLERGDLGPVVELELDLVLVLLGGLLLRLLQPLDERVRLLVDLLGQLLRHVLLAHLESVRIVRISHKNVNL